MRALAKSRIGWRIFVDDLCSLIAKDDYDNYDDEGLKTNIIFFEDVKKRRFNRRERSGK